MRSERQRGDEKGSAFHRERLLEEALEASRDVLLSLDGRMDTYDIATGGRLRGYWPVGYRLRVKGSMRADTEISATSRHGRHGNVEVGYTMPTREILNGRGDER